MFANPNLGPLAQCGRGRQHKARGGQALARAAGGAAQHSPVTASPRKPQHGGMVHMGLQRTGSMPPACFALPHRFQASCLAAGFTALVSAVGLGVLLVPTNIRPRCARYLLGRVVSNIRLIVGQAQASGHP